MPALDTIVLPECDPPLLLGLELHFLAAMHAGRSLPVLIVYALPGHLISIGRYHLYGGPERRGGVRALRRLTGGRIVGAGQGWVGTALLLPGWSALPAARGLPLKPDQIMNRCVRGALAALRTMGLDCLYPGRDAVTVERREIAICSFETDASSALLFELMLAVGRGMEDLVHDLERFDPDGALVSPMYGPEVATNVARELKREASFAEVADALARGYASMLGEVEPRRLNPAER
ncbi:MAG: hypothetical protein WA005_16855, partial [Candidatus Binataceae bacterium]